jgi:hypothetical protein
MVANRKSNLGNVFSKIRPTSPLRTLFCNSKGKRASLFVINQNDVGVRFDKKRKYIVEEDDFKVTLWKESGMVYAMVI